MDIYRFREDCGKIFIQECEKAGISVDVSDQKETGQPIRVSFKGDLRMQQELAAEKLLSHSDRVLSAATAFGKTVVCSYLIAEPFLVLLLFQVWFQELPENPVIMPGQSRCQCLLTLKDISIPEGVHSCLSGNHSFAYMEKHFPEKADILACHPFESDSKIFPII